MSTATQLKPIRSVRGQPSHSAGTWRAELRQAVRDPDELCTLLELPDTLRPAAQRAAQAFGLIVPRGFVARMRRGDAKDPLLRQVLPLEEELDDHPGTSDDPVGDLQANPLPGLLHKYQGRVLLVLGGACAIHCRYCFRRHFPYHETPRGLHAWRPALDQIAADRSVHEVILSGGDPLLVADELLAELVRRLADIPHVARLRVHTRLPIVLPQRVTTELVTWLRGTRLAAVMVVHANHPAELDHTVADALARLVDAGIPVLNQAVLLRGVNDDVESLATLSERLVNLRVLPYYLHQLDRVRGAAHFAVPPARGRQLMAQLRRRLPGYAVPQYVHERPGAPHKLRLG